MLNDALQNIANAIINLGKISFLDWFSSIVSLGSLIFAILIPVRIAKKQNDIALFEKRLLLYSEVVKLCDFSKRLQNIEEIAIGIPKYIIDSKKKEMLIENFNLIFPSNLSNSTINIISTINNCRLMIESMEFLYFKEIKPNSMDFKDDIDKIFESLIMLMKKSEREDCFDYSDSKRFRENLDYFVLKYLDIIKEPLKM